MAAQGPGICRECEKYVPARDADGNCRNCAEAVEIVVQKMMRQWDKDLDLMARFEAFCRTRPDEPPGD